MYELKKNGKVFTSKSVGTGPSSYEKMNLPGRCLTKVEKHGRGTSILSRTKCLYGYLVCMISNRRVFVHSHASCCGGT